MSLHAELPAHRAIIVDHEIIHPRLPQLLTHRQPRRACAHDGYRRAINFGGGTIGRLFRRQRRLFYPANFPHAIHLRDANAPHVAVYQHFAGAALADSALHRARTVL